MSLLPETTRQALSALQGSFILACVVRASFPRLALHAGAKSQNIIDQPVSVFKQGDVLLARVEAFRTAVYLPCKKIDTNTVTQTLCALQVHGHEIEHEYLNAGLDLEAMQKALFHRPVPRIGG